MDHNLDDALNLEGAMVDFEHSEDTVVNQADISLDATHEESITMEYENIEEQSMLMETGNEEIIVSDFMGDQFTLQEYETQEDEMAGGNIKIEPQENVIVSKPGDILDIQFDEPISVPASGVITEEINMHPKIISVKAAVPTVRAIAPRRDQLVLGKAGAPRQVAIAPKPARLVQSAGQKVGQLGPGKQYALAPRPPAGAGAAHQHALAKPAKGNTVLAIGKQLVVMPSAQKIKLVAGARRVLGGSPDQAQLIQNVSTSQAQGSKVTKVIVQGSQADLSNQPAVITKLISMSSTQPAQARYVTVHHRPKPVPITIGSKKVVLASPTKAGSGAKKSQLIAIKSPTAPAPSAQSITKKVVVRPNPTTPNVVLRAASTPGTVTNVSAGQRTQVHQINVPGKGIQYIRLVTNPPPPALKPAQKPQVVLPSSKTFVLTDGKGNLIQMTAEKVMSTQPPPLLLTGGVTSGKVSSKTPHKLVRLAPVSSKLGQAVMNRGGQSLLAPLSPMPEEPQPTRVTEDPELMEEAEQQLAFVQPPGEPPARADHAPPAEHAVQEEEIDSKAALRALIADTVGSDAADDEPPQNTSADIDVEFGGRQSHDYSDSNSGSAERAAAPSQHPLIVIPPYMKQDVPDNDNYESSRRMSGLINVEVDVGSPYDAYRPASDQALSDTDMVPTELGLRPRKACNCTKSQCLKLYCDCFANGEFCNRCNCNNCHNNLENEELRQKAIRGCLDRNPNAFRPKIGKSRTGGPENFRRHNKGCNCKRSGCLKNYCECYEAKIACTAICKCVGCRNVEESLERSRRRDTPRGPAHAPPSRDPARLNVAPGKQPCSFMTTEVIEAVCQCLLAAAVESGDKNDGQDERDPVRDVIDEFARCLQDIISASHQAAPLELCDEAQA